MFTKELANKLLKIIGERDLSVEAVAEASHLSRKYLGNIIKRRQVPSLYVFEKICTGLQLDPNDLLLNEKSKTAQKSQPMEVNKFLCSDDIIVSFCPDCNRPLEREYQAYCDRCGRRLSWHQYSYAEKIDASNLKLKI